MFPTLAGLVLDSVPGLLSTPHPCSAVPNSGDLRGVGADSAKILSIRQEFETPNTASRED